MEVKEYIESGIVRMYILGYTTDEESMEFERMLSLYPEVVAEFELQQQALADFADESSVSPHPSLKPMMDATFDYMSRLESGEPFMASPVLTEESTIDDFRLWIDREDMVAPEDFEDIHAKLITATPDMTCAMVWIKNMAPAETHSDEYERFLILEGTCTIVVGSEENYLKPGDYFAIPLHEDHKVIVTSETPCVVILQRIAA